MKILFTRNATTPLKNKNNNNILLYLLLFRKHHNQFVRNLFKNKYFLLLLMFCLSVAFVYGQDMPPKPPDGGRPPPGLPIDGGIIILGIIAVAYGVTKKNKKD